MIVLIFCLLCPGWGVYYERVHKTEPVVRVTAETKIATRDRILASARNLFSEKGFDQTTTRDIATAAKIATGTLFNYFPTKEAVATTIVASLLDDLHTDPTPNVQASASAEERLFAFILASLKRLAPVKHYVGAVVETTLSPFARAPQCEAAEDIRVRHLEMVAEMLASDRDTQQPSFVTAHLYWSLFLGVLAFWSGDESDHQEDTLVLLDQATRLFVSSVTNPGNSPASGTDGGRS